MSTNRRKAVKDRPNHREKVQKWHANKLARKVAKRLLGKEEQPIKATGREWWV